MVKQCWALLYTDDLMDMHVCPPGTIQSEVLMPLIKINRACLIPSAYSMLCNFISEEETMVEFPQFYNGPQACNSYRPEASDFCFEPVNS